MKDLLDLTKKETNAPRSAPKTTKENVSSSITNPNSNPLLMQNNLQNQFMQQMMMNPMGMNMYASNAGNFPVQPNMMYSVPSSMNSNMMSSINNSGGFDPNASQPGLSNLNIMNPMMMNQYYYMMMNAQAQAQMMGNNQNQLQNMNAMQNMNVGQTLNDANLSGMQNFSGLSNQLNSTKTSVLPNNNSGKFGNSVQQPFEDDDDPFKDMPNKIDIKNSAVLSKKTESDFTSLGLYINETEQNYYQMLYDVAHIKGKEILGLKETSDFLKRSGIPNVFIHTN